LVISVLAVVRGFAEALAIAIPITAKKLTPRTAPSSFVVTLVIAVFLVADEQWEKCSGLPDY
jgi:hypothetical protein